ncbi:MAG: DUF1211 domain-containing protein [Mycobacterium sp.]|nr:DUF1211 domain-containing protein [Mycobacterium sp.]
MSDAAGRGTTGDRGGPEGARDLDRVVFFSDAVFAIAMTVLVLTLQLPAGTTDSEVAHALRTALPSVYAYALSFAVISLYWLAHHRMFRYVRRLDPNLLVLNLALLGFVAFVPFPTSVLGDHGGTTAAVVFYASTMAILGSLISALWFYASHEHLIAAEASPTFIRHSLWRGLAVPVVFAASIPIAFVNPYAAEYFWLTIVIWRVLLRRHYGTRGYRRAERGM